MKLVRHKTKSLATLGSKSSYDGKIEIYHINKL